MNPRPLRFALALLVSSWALAQTYVIDGSISDWAINPTTLRSSTARGQTFEDQTGASTGVYLGPQYGGQVYDAEAIYVDWNLTTLYVGILTGMPPTHVNYSPGDILFDFNYSPIDSNLGSTSTPDYGLVLTTHMGLTPGNLYQGTTWLQGEAAASSMYAVAVKTGTVVGTSSTVSMVYAATPITGLGAYTTDAHYFIEAAVPLSAFGSLWTSEGLSQSLEIRWGPTCANDLISVGLAATVPEPSTWAGVGLMVAGLIFVRFRRSTHHA